MIQQYYYALFITLSETLLALFLDANIRLTLSYESMRSYQLQDSFFANHRTIYLTLYIPFHHRPQILTEQPVYHQSYPLLFL